MLTEDQLKAMEASAPLLVAEVRRLKANMAEVLQKAQVREAQSYALGYSRGYDAAVGMVGGTRES